MLLSISLAAAMAAIAFGVVHVAGVTAEDRFTLVHLEFAAVVLVPAVLLIVERWPWTEQSAARLGLPARRTADGGPGAVGRRRSTAASAARGRLAVVSCPGWGGRVGCAGAGPRCAGERWARPELGLRSGWPGRVRRRRRWWLRRACGGRLQWTARRSAQP